MKSQNPVSSLLEEEEEALTTNEPTLQIWKIQNPE